MTDMKVAKVFDRLLPIVVVAFVFNAPLATLLSDAWLLLFDTP